MKYFIFLCFLGTLLTCNSEIESDDSIPIQEDVTDREPGVIPTDNKYFEFVTSNSDEYAWKDVDSYYRKAKKELANVDYYENLQKKLIDFMINRKGMLESADIETVEFYFHESQKPRAPFPRVTIQFLDRIKKERSAEVVQVMAMQAIEKYLVDITKAGQQSLLELPNIKDPLDRIRQLAGNSY